jgi:hypothetical protein
MIIDAIEGAIGIIATIILVGLPVLILAAIIEAVAPDDAPGGMQPQRCEGYVVSNGLDVKLECKGEAGEFVLRPGETFCLMDNKSTIYCEPQGYR